MKTYLEELYENTEINYIYENYKWTPSMIHWKEIKENAIKKYGPNTVVFYQLGSFFECYFHDAYLSSKLVNQSLTSKNKNNPLAAPMSGSPLKSGYQKAHELVKQGYNVIIVEEIGIAGSKDFQRVITQTLTPGSTLDTIGSLENNFIYALSGDEEDLGIVFLDVSSNAFYSVSYKRKDIERLKTFFTLYPPKEILYSNKELIQSFSWVICNFLPFSSVSIQKQDIAVKIEEKVGKNLHIRRAVSYILGYVEEIHKTSLTYIDDIQLINPYHYFFLEETTIKNLEIFKNSSGYVEYSLLDTIRKTQTSFWGRMLKNFLIKPWTDKKSIEMRQDGVTFFYNNEETRQKIYTLLYKINDIERLASKIISNKITPNDILSLKESLRFGEKIKELLEKETLPYILKRTLETYPDVSDLLLEIERVLQEKGGVSSKDGDIINAGVDKELDELIIKTSGRDEWYREYQERITAETNIRCKVTENSLGAYIEVSKEVTEIPENWKRIKMLKDFDRYETRELVDFYRDSFDATARRNLLEHKLFHKLRLFCSIYITRIQEISKKIGLIDVLLSLALLAHEKNYTRPLLRSDKQTFIKNGRHPVIENLCNFIPNDINITEKEVHIITGPNMWGKSTYLRQTALISLLAQIGSYIPADTGSEIGIVDNIFTRIGASDNITQGESTFFIEMKETSDILKKTTSNSLIILDEIGRGTSTEEGESLAEALVEYLRDKKIRTLFATHYHRLSQIPGIENYFVEWAFDEKGIIYFEHKIKKGSSSSSYGIEIARLTGIPNEIIQRAYQLKDWKWN